MGDPADGVTGRPLAMERPATHSPIGGGRIADAPPTQGKGATDKKPTGSGRFNEGTHLPPVARKTNPKKQSPLELAQAAKREVAAKAQQLHRAEAKLAQAKLGTPGWTAADNHVAAIREQYKDAAIAYYRAWENLDANTSPASPQFEMIHNEYFEAKKFVDEVADLYFSQPNALEVEVYRLAERDGRYLENADKVFKAAEAVKKAFTDARSSFDAARQRAKTETGEAKKQAVAEVLKKAEELKAAAQANVDASMQALNEARNVNIKGNNSVEVAEKNFDQAIKDQSSAGQDAWAVKQGQY